MGRGADLPQGVLERAAVGARAQLDQPGAEHEAEEQPAAERRRAPWREAEETLKKGEKYGNEGNHELRTGGMSRQGHEVCRGASGSYGSLQR